MTNKPMLSVELRALLNNCADYMEGSDSAKVKLWHKELRALLDKPECSTCKDSGVVDDGELTHSAGGIPYECGPIKCVKDCPDCNKPAAQHQGEPVAYMCNGGTRLLFAKDRELAIWNAGRPLYLHQAEQPESVALVMPERMADTWNGSRDHMTYDKGYNDALDGVVRLNGVKP